MSVLTELTQTMKAPRGPKRRLTLQEKQDQRAAYVFLLPWLIGLVGITIGPMVASLYLSLTDYNFLQTPNFVGAENYVKLAADPRFLKALGVTFQYVLWGVPLQLVMALAIAMLLDRGLRGMALYRSIFYLPSLIGGSVAIAIIWRQVFGAAGVLNQFLALFGVEGKSWIANPDTALGTLVVLHVWTFGAPMIIFLAGLRQIPVSYYEAASVDGATPVQKFFHITLPLLSPIIFFNLILQLIGSFQAFTQAFIISGGSGAPSDSTLFYTLYLYMQGFGNFRMGYASAMAWVLVLIIGALTVLNFLVSKYWVFYND